MDATNARKRAVIPGKAILGEVAAEAAARATFGGAVVPGRAILGEQGAHDANRSQLAHRHTTVVADPKAAKGKKPEKAKKPDTGSANPVDKDKEQEPPPASMKEEEAIELVDKNPNAWETVLTTEVARADGVRTEVARALLQAGSVATKPEMPNKLVKMLTGIVTEADKAAKVAAGESGDDGGEDGGDEGDGEEETGSPVPPPPAAAKAPKRPKPEKPAKPSKPAKKK